MKMIFRLVIFTLASIVLFSVNSFAADTPRKGGVLTYIQANGPATFYPREGGPTELGASFPAMEPLMAYTSRRTLEPFLAEKVDINKKNLTITFYLKKGIKFHDGSELTSKDVAGVYNYSLKVNRIQYGDKIKRVEIVDKYTVRLYLTTYNNQLIHSFGYQFIWSDLAFQTKDKDYLRTHPIGTGPFILKEWQRDVYMKWVKNPNYWQKGKPLLDEVIIRYIPDNVAASTMMQVGEADLWSGGDPKDQVELQAKGFKRKYGYAALPIMLLPNTANPERPTSKLKVREAIEYAIDKAAIAKAIGFGLYSPLKFTAPEGEWGYDPDFEGRPYNPEKAKKLLKEAGYSRGLKLDLMAFQGFGGTYAPEALRAFLNDAGIKIHIDMADPGRYFGAMWGSGWKDLLLGFTGLDPTYLVTFQRWFSHDPATNLVGFKRSPALVKLSKESLLMESVADQMAITKKLVRQIHDDAAIIPIYNAPAALVAADYVHTSYYDEGFLRWRVYDDWIEKR